MIRILHIVSTMNMGGIENYLMNVYRNIDRTKVQFDFIVHDLDEGYYDNEIYKLGGKIYKVPRKKDNVIKNFFQIMNIVKKNEYRTIHRHGSNSQMSLDLLASKIGGANTLISHSHSNRATGFNFSHKIFKKLLLLVSTHRFATSNEAGVHLYGDSNFKIINNGIDVNRFKFNHNKREEMRKEFSINENTFVLGNVGRLKKVKHQLFLINVFYEFNKLHEDSILMIVGEGPEREEIEKKIVTLGLTDRVILTGLQENIEDFYQIFDTFVLPSNNEGLGLVLIESQASGLKSFASKNVVPVTTKVSDLMNFISLDESANVWARDIFNNSFSNVNRKYYNNVVYDSKFNIESTSKELEKIYINSFVN